MDRSDEINELVPALAKAQAAMTNVNKGSRAKIATKAGGEYSYTYADLGDIYEMLRKPLADNGLAIMQVPAVGSNSVDVETILAHTSGQWIGCTVSVGAMTADPKAIGSAITYARRYGMALIGVVTDDDDDGERATGKAPVQKARPSQATIVQSTQDAPGWQDVASAPSPVEQKATGNGHTEPTQEHKSAALKPPKIRTPNWAPRATALHQKLFEAGCPKYAQADGTVDLYHMAMSAAKCEFAEITDANLDAVLAAIERRATANEPQ